MIKAIIFDLNGIFIQSPLLSDRFLEKFDVPTKMFLPVLKKILAKIRKPKAGDAFKYWKPYLKQWNVRLNKKEFFDFWFKAEKEDPALVELAKKIKQQGIKIFILSNNFKERAVYYKNNFKFLSIFDKIYYSWQTGFVKPNPKAFKQLLAQEKLKAEECLYFDNSLENVEVAQRLNMKAYPFVDLRDLKIILKENQIF